MIRITLLIFTLFVFFACKNQGSESTPEIIDVDTSEVEFVQEEDVFFEVEDTGKSEVEEATEEIVKKYGEQWDFCTCIVTQDSINKAMMEDIPDEEFDRLMERSDFIDNKCKTLLIQPNNTPEERAKHEKKVKNCLRNAK